MRRIYLENHLYELQCIVYNKVIPYMSMMTCSFNDQYYHHHPGGYCFRCNNTNYEPLIPHRNMVYALDNFINKKHETNRLP